MEVINDANEVCKKENIHKIYTEVKRCVFGRDSPTTPWLEVEFQTFPLIEFK